MMPRMIVVGGPPGAGKSTLLPDRSFGVDAFNIDDRCSELHGGYVGIPKTVRAAAAGECERFIVEHIHCRRSFAVETTMRTAVAIEQARLARENGFTTLLWFLCAADPTIHVHRVAARGTNGGHAAPEAEIRATYAASLRHLADACRVFDLIECFDTTTHGMAGHWVATVRAGRACVRANPAPTWLDDVLASMDE